MLNESTACANRVLSSSVIAAFLLMLGIYGAGWHIAEGILNMKRAERHVSIRGVAEQMVQADTVGWTISFIASGDQLAAVISKIEKDQAAVTAFLTKRGFSAEEISFGKIGVVDLMSQQYRSGDVASNRYIINASVQLRSSKVAAAETASRSLTDLVKENVVLGDSQGPYYSFTKLNDIKPAMLVSATQEAKKAADEFIKTTGAELGTLKTASQGLFSIEGRDEIIQENEQVNKKVRVVTTLEYFLKD